MDIIESKTVTRFEDSGDFFRCPICGESLLLRDKSLVCAKGHCYDIAKTGYVNFVPGKVQQKQKNYDRESFENRRTVLGHGLYSHILEELIGILNRMPSVKTVLDAGCGEGFYAKAVRERTDREVLAFDISKDSVQLAAQSDAAKKVKWFVADLAQLPVNDCCIDCILDIFSPANYTEFHRILAPGGYLIKVIPGEGHLKELREKAKGYLRNSDYSNQQVVDYFEKHVPIVFRRKVTAGYRITPEERSAFINMTPLLFHVKTEDIDWSSIDYLTIEAEILIAEAKKE